MNPQVAKKIAIRCSIKSLLGHIDSLNLSLYTLQHLDSPMDHILKQSRVECILGIHKCLWKKLLAGLHHLSSLVNLEDLNMAYVQGCTNSTLLSIASLTQLKSLSVDTCPQVTDVWVLLSYRIHQGLQAERRSPGTSSFGPIRFSPSRFLLYYGNSETRWAIEGISQHWNLVWSWKPGIISLGSPVNQQFIFAVSVEHE